MSSNSAVTNGGIVNSKSSTFVPSVGTRAENWGDEVYIPNTQEYYKNVGWKYGVGYIWIKLSPATTPSGGGLTWQATSTSLAMNSNYGYILQNTSSPISLTLPTSSNVGDTMQVVADLGCAGFSITEGATQQMVLTPTQATPLGGSFSVQSPAQAIVMTFICTVANTRWVVSTNFNGAIS